MRVTVSVSLAMVTLDTGSTLPPPQRIEPSYQPFSFLISSQPAAPPGIVSAHRPRNAVVGAAARSMVPNKPATTRPRTKLHPNLEVLIRVSRAILVAGDCKD